MHRPTLRSVVTLTLGIVQEPDKRSKHSPQEKQAKPVIIAGRIKK